MKIGGNFPEPRALVSTERAWRVEKPTASSDLREQSHRNPERALVASKSRTASSATRCGTRIIDGDQQLLQPAFVAQVLGQILSATQNDAATAARAYTLYNRRAPDPQFAKIA